MPDPKVELPESLIYNPIWRKGDPGPDWPWIFEDISFEAKVQLVVSQLEYEKEVVVAQSKAIDRNIAILKGAGAHKR